MDIASFPLLAKRMQNYNNRKTAGNLMMTNDYLVHTLAQNDPTLHFFSLTRSLADEIIASATSLFEEKPPQEAHRANRVLRAMQAHHAINSIHVDGQALGKLVAFDARLNRNDDASTLPHTGDRANSEGEAKADTDSDYYFNYYLFENNPSAPKAKLTQHVLLSFYHFPIRSLFLNELPLGMHNEHHNQVLLGIINLVAHLSGVYAFGAVDTFLPPTEKDGGAARPHHPHHRHGTLALLDLSNNEALWRVETRESRDLRDSLYVQESSGASPLSSDTTRTIVRTPNTSNTSNLNTYQVLPLTRTEAMVDQRRATLLVLLGKVLFFSDSIAAAASGDPPHHPARSSLQKVCLGDGRMGDFSFLHLLNYPGAKQQGPTEERYTLNRALVHVDFSGNHLVDNLSFERVRQLFLSGVPPRRVDLVVHLEANYWRGSPSRNIKYTVPGSGSDPEEEEEEPERAASRDGGSQAPAPPPADARMVVDRFGTLARVAGQLLQQQVDWTATLYGRRTSDGAQGDEPERGRVPSGGHAAPASSTGHAEDGDTASHTNASDAPFTAAAEKVPLQLGLSGHDKLRLRIQKRIENGEGEILDKYYYLKMLPFLGN
ncbi:hypothetical protein STCU_10913 [Strigomonas culicis]|uniref:Uncharacterized protein n=1 Tax=Strigomonas culicis TaxID=28005 RepID=S9V263_9TRYP|nr:hypothetical protein STCU_10913 [Strigomonas culicis]|eukprot:EPY16915.1 hypothetical protein STCU_10913 [Strigomonas culicis]